MKPTRVKPIVGQSCSIGNTWLDTAQTDVSTRFSLYWYWNNGPDEWIFNGMWVIEKWLCWAIIRLLIIVDLSTILSAENLLKFSAMVLSQCFNDYKSGKHTLAALSYFCSEFCMVIFSLNLVISSLNLVICSLYSVGYIVLSPVTVRASLILTLCHF